MMGIVFALPADLEVLDLESGIFARVYSGVQVFSNDVDMIYGLGTVIGECREYRIDPRRFCFLMPVVQGVSHCGRVVA